MRAAIHSRLRVFAADERAATAVEFAILITPLLVLILASLQLATIFFANQALESAAITAGRQLMTGADQNAGVTQSQFQQAVCANASFLFSCKDVMVDVESASAYSNINTTPLTLTYDPSGKVTNSWAYSPGSAGDIVILRVMYNWPVVGAPLLPGLANQPGDQRLLVATAVFKNEPFQ